MDDVELRETVESILGQGIRLLDVEKKTTFKSEEVLLINGTAVPLVGAEGDVIRQALLNGQVPPSDVLNSLLIAAGIWRHPVRLQTELTVKQTTLNRDTISVSRQGRVVDERLKETKEEDLLRKSSTEVWRAVTPPSTAGPTLVMDFKPIPTPPPPTPPPPQQNPEKGTNIRCDPETKIVDDVVVDSQPSSVRAPPLSTPHFFLLSRQLPLTLHPLVSLLLLLLIHYFLYKNRKRTSFSLISLT